MNIQINNNQIKQMSLNISKNDVLNFISNDYDSYILFLYNELNNNQITREEYNEELLSIDSLTIIEVTV